MNFCKTTAMAAVLLPAIVVAQEPAGPGASAVDGEMENTATSKSACVQSVSKQIPAKSEPPA